MRKLKVTFLLKMTVVTERCLAVEQGRRRFVLGTISRAGTWLDDRNLK